MHVLMKWVFEWCVDFLPRNCLSFYQNVQTAWLSILRTCSKTSKGPFLHWTVMMTVSGRAWSSERAGPSVSTSWAPGRWSKMSAWLLGPLIGMWPRTPEAPVSCWHPKRTTRSSFLTSKTSVWPGLFWCRLQGYSSFQTSWWGPSPRSSQQSKCYLKKNLLVRSHLASGNQMNTVYSVFIMLFLGTICFNFEKADVTFVFVGRPAQPQQCENWRSLEFAGFASTGLKLCKVSEGDSSSTETSRTHSATEIPLAARRAMLSDQQLPGCRFSPGLATNSILL